MENFQYPQHRVHCIITAPGCCGKSGFLKNLILNIINDFNRIYIYSPSLHQDFYQKLNKNCSNYIPNNIMPNVLNEEDIDIVIEEIVNDVDFQKSNTEIETYESVEELNYQQDYDDGGIFILNDLNEKEMNDSWV